MLPDRVSNPGPLTYESGALPIALRGPTELKGIKCQNSKGFLVLRTINLTFNWHNSSATISVCYFTYTVFNNHPLLYLSCIYNNLSKIIKTLSFDYLPFARVGRLTFRN